MTNYQETIAAISTAPGIGAIAIVRLSGPNAFNVACEVFVAGKPAGQEKNANTAFTTHIAKHGFVVNPVTAEIIDEVILTPYKGPHTYTGEDLVEIACHGGPVVTKEILWLLLSRGARLGRPGEFTERAFMNGRIDLMQAEAVLDIIQAKTSRQGRMAISVLTGGLGDRIKPVRAELLSLLTRVVAGIDFPEEIGDTPEPEIETIVERCLKVLNELAKSAYAGRVLREGLKLALVGRPNAGKSTLLNQLLKFERAIVTDVPGTTRDVLEELLDLNGIPVILVDTAGIHHTEDQVEKIGIERSKSAISQADLIIFVTDVEKGWGQPEDEISKMLQAKPYLLAVNKIDLLTQQLPEKVFNKQLSPACLGEVCISAKTGANLLELTCKVESWVFQGQPEQDFLPLNVRQGELCLKAIRALELVKQTLAAGYPQDCLALDLKAAVDDLSEMSGESVSEEIIQQVFANFCLGK